MRHTKGLRRGEGLFASAVAIGACAAILATASVEMAFAQDRGSSGRISTVTRLVRIMLEHEEQLDAAARDGNRQALDRLLAEDFEMRIGTAPGTPVPRDEWMTNALAKPAPAQRIEQMSAHELGGVVVASFLERPEATTRTDSPTFVTDVWKKSGDDWKLVRRFVAPASASAFEPMGAGARTPSFPKR